LLKATAPKIFGTIAFFFMLVTARTLSSISASFSSSEEISSSERLDPTLYEYANELDA
jgi:hypothetical protein